MARKNAIVSVSVSDANVISFNVTGHDPIILDTALVSAEVSTRAMIHGIVQKISDAAALGKDSTPSDKHAAMQSVVDRLLSGEWNKRTGDGSDAPVSGLIFRAFTEWANSKRDAKKQIPEAKLRGLYDGKTRAEQLAYRNVPEIKTIMDRMKAERGPITAIDATALLDELNAL